jgi:uncharacterized repeat protein (TIGR01451 family)
MIERIARRMGSLRLAGCERGGVALIMLIGFIGLAVPITIASVQTSAQLSRNSSVYDSRLAGMYSASAGIEVALWEILNDPGFDDDMSEQSPTKDITVENDGNTVLVTVTKIYTDATLQGQGVVVSKAVSPATASVNATTTFTYDITLQNEGTDTITVEKIYDYLPPGFTYASSTTSGPTTSDPDVTLAPEATCGGVPRKLTWNVPAQSETLAPSEEMTLTFQATAALPDGTYYNQAASLYDPWWDASNVLVYTPYTAEVTVGTGTPKCGYGMKALVTHEVEPENPPIGIETEFTYTVTFENTSAGNIYVCQIEDLLPPTFTYVTSSSGDPLYSDNIDTSEPTLTWQSTPERWDLAWEDISQGKFVPLATTTPGETRTQKFRASAIPESGVNYYNEVEIVWATSLTGQGKCSTNQGESGTAFSGTGNATYVDPPTLYDIRAIAPDGTVESRIVFYQFEGEIDIISWQEY